MRKAFITGLAILSPLVLTYIIIMFLVDILTGPFLKVIHGLPSPVLKPLILIFLFGLIVLTGYFAKRTFFNLPFLNRLPFYTLFSDTITTLFNARDSKFTKVFLVPFPTKDSYAIGFSNGNESIFIPATPNPTVGFIIQSKDAIELDMSVPDGFKLIIAFGYQENDKSKSADSKDA